MPAPRMLYYITDRTAFAADEPTRRRHFLEKSTKRRRPESITSNSVKKISPSAICNRWRKKR